VPVNVDVCLGERVPGQVPRGHGYGKSQLIVTAEGDDNLRAVDLWISAFSN